MKIVNIKEEKFNIEIFLTYIFILTPIVVFISKFVSDFFYH